MRRKIVSIVIMLVFFATIATVPIPGSDQIDIEIKQPSTGLAPKSFHQPQTSNDVFEKQQATLGVPYYGFVAYDPAAVLPIGPCSFLPTTPGTITSLAPTTSTDFISGGTMAKGAWWGCEYGGGGNTNIWTIDTSSGAMTLVGDYDPGNTGVSFNGLSYDPGTETMYACSDSALYTVDMTTGASTLVGAFNVGMMVGIAFDDMGALYAVDIIDNALYKVDKYSGAAIAIGPVGPDLNYAQDIAFDYDTQTMYLSAFTISPDFEGALYTVNLLTGTGTKVGPFQGGSEITGFAIPGAELEISNPTGPIGIKANLKNVGFEDAINVEWSIDFSGGIILLPAGGLKTGTLGSLTAGEEVVISAIAVGFGGLARGLNITISANADNAAAVSKTVGARLLFVLLFI